MTTRMVIIGGGPAGHSCASTAARLGADVVVIERDTIGGAAHLWDCIPSKAMIATGNARSFVRRSMRMGLEDVGSEVDLAQLRERLKVIEERLEHQIRGSGRLKHCATAYIVTLTLVLQKRYFVDHLRLQIVT